MINLKDPKSRKKFIKEVCQYELKFIVASVRLHTLKKAGVHRGIYQQMFADTMGWGINGSEVWTKLFREALTKTKNKKGVRHGL